MESLELPQDQPIIPAISKLEQKDGEDFIAYIARPCLKTNKNKAVGTGGLSERLLKPISIGENSLGLYETCGSYFSDLRHAYFHKECKILF